jgi:uncharacterized protein (DUF302 family)
MIGIVFGHDQPSMPAERRWAQKGSAFFGPLRTAGIVLALALSVTVGAKAMDRDGLITIQSRYTAKETMQRLETAVKAKGMSVFAHIDHAAGAAEVGMTLRPTDLLIFGSPKGGTPLMQSVQTIGIDLPLKALVWEDAEGHVWLSYHDPARVARRHGEMAGTEAAVQTMAGALKAIATEAASTSPKK